MASVQLHCEIDGCSAIWSVPSRQMKQSLDDHRTKFHRGWVKPDPKPADAYRLDYRGRGRQL
jgi:hypothetical protein